MVGWTLFFFREWGVGEWGVGEWGSGEWGRGGVGEGGSGGVLPSAFCLLPSAFCLLPSAFCLLPSLRYFLVGSDRYPTASILDLNRDHGKMEANTSEVPMVIAKERDTQVVILTANTTAYRSRSWKRLRFELEYAREKGTTANTYVIQADQTAVIDPPGESFCPLFLEALQARLDLTTIQYVIVSHINPNRAATLKALLDLAPHLTLVCSNLGAKNLEVLLPDQPLKIQVMKSESDRLNLGQGHILQFFPTPTPRHPAELLTYDPKDRILYTDKFFSTHFCGDQVFDEGWEMYREDRQYYFDSVMASHARQVLTALEKLEDLLPSNDSPAPGVAFYAPAHGPMVRYGLVELTNLYQQWSQAQQNKSLTVALLYASAYGNTATLAQAIARGITKAGVQVEAINCEAAEPDSIKTTVEQAAGFIIGSPTLGGHAPTQIQTALGIVLSNVPKDRLAAVFGSFGWSGEAIDLLESKLKDAGYSFGFDPIRVKFKPTDQTLKFCEEAGTDFAQKLKKAQKRRQPRALNAKSASGLTTVTATEEAVGRIVGSLGIVTTQREEVSSAMLASWISQATFSPPGFTVAVAKERAIDSLLFPGCHFVLNILPDGNHIPLMRHFLKPFGPGENRFENVETDTAENGCPILKGASAYLECTVSSRMECGDHWVVYSTVQLGQVLDASAKTAVHQRKSGTHY
ncbi:MAG: diflavin flavoprotein [Leptolyngbyaceae cyanobacterium]